MTHDNQINAHLPASFLFPTDLYQADGAHCSVDALLLAAFAQGHGLRAVDLGAGCGVVGLGLLLRGVAAVVHALELDAEQVACARRNAELWRMADVLRVTETDIVTGESKETPGPERLLAEACTAAEGAKPANAADPDLADLVVCNPPWRLLDSQRPPQCTRRRQALFGTQETVPQFARAGAARLRRGGVFVLIIGAERLPDALAAVRAAELSPARLRCVHPRPGREAVFALLESRYGVRARLHIEPPLVLHGAQGPDYTPEAHAFCPWLGKKRGYRCCRFP